jgi:hypothetical protein
VAGSGVQGQKCVAAATTRVATAIKNTTTHRKFGLLDRGPTCHGFDLVFELGGDVTTSPPEAPIACFFGLQAGYAKPHVDHFCFVWTILRRASTKNYRRVGVGPCTLEAPRFFGFVCPNQPHTPPFRRVRCSGGACWERRQKYPRCGETGGGSATGRAPGRRGLSAAKFFWEGGGRQGKKKKNSPFLARAGPKKKKKPVVGPPGYIGGRIGRCSS